MSSSEVDAAFSVLPQHLRDRIDQAFNDAIQQFDIGGHGPPLKKRKLGDTWPASSDGGFLAAHEGSIAPGGFVVDEPGGFVVDGPHGGGFVVSSDDESRNDDEVVERSRIPLSLIPSALQLLDLPPDDEDVLTVFRNAASGWDQTGRSEASQSALFVERRDWHAVCAALLEPQDGGEGGEDHDMGVISDPPGDIEESLSGSGDGDDYMDLGSNDASADEDGDEDADYSDDEYQELPRTKTRGKQNSASISRPSVRSRTRPAPEEDSEGEEDDVVRRVTPRQKAECRKAYALFFPDVKDKALESQRLMIKDITRVAKVLKEKISAEEIVEMLEQFSTSPDKSMDLGDFERMMITARLV